MSFLFFVMDTNFLLISRTSINLHMFTAYINVLVFFLKCLIACQSRNSLEDKTYLLSHGDLGTDPF